MRLSSQMPTACRASAESAERPCSSRNCTTGWEVDDRSPGLSKPESGIPPRLHNPSRTSKHAAKSSPFSASAFSSRSRAGLERRPRCRMRFSSQMPMARRASAESAERPCSSRNCTTALAVGRSVLLDVLAEEDMRGRSRICELRGPARVRSEIEDPGELKRRLLGRLVLARLSCTSRRCSMRWWRVSLGPAGMICDRRCERGRADDHEIHYRPWCCQHPHTPGIGPPRCQDPEEGRLS